MDKPEKKQVKNAAVGTQYDRMATMFHFLKKADEIECHLYEEEVIKGKLIEIGQYEILISVKGVQVCVFKHAIKFVRIISLIAE